jgi:hypothetical protein
MGPWLWWLLVLLVELVVVPLLTTTGRLGLPLLPAGRGLPRTFMGLPSGLAGRLLLASAARSACAAAGGVRASEARA